MKFKISQIFRHLELPSVNPWRYIRRNEQSSYCIMRWRREAKLLLVVYYIIILIIRRCRWPVADCPLSLIFVHTYSPESTVSCVERTNSVPLSNNVCLEWFGMGTRSFCQAVLMIGYPATGHWRYASSSERTVRFDGGLAIGSPKTISVFFSTPVKISCTVPGRQRV